MSARTKVAITAVGGWENSVLLALTGNDLDAKAGLVERSVHRYTEAVDGVDAVAIDRIGQAQEDPDSQNAATELLRIAVQGTKEAAGRAFSSRMVELALSSYPRLVCPRPATSRVGIRRRLARTAGPGDARPHRPPPSRHDRDHRTRQPP